MKIQRISPVTGEWNEMDIDITEEQFTRFLSGEHISVVFPNLTRIELDFILTGYTKQDSENLFENE